MNESFLNFSGSNPFSTRFTAPGKAPFFFDSAFCDRIRNSHPTKFEAFFNELVGRNGDFRNAICIKFLIDKFETHSCRGQIVGNHGSGKSSLLHVLKDEMLNQGYEIFSWSLHDQKSFLPDQFWQELQLFLQTNPLFLPTKFLLPPPVMTQEEFVRQQRAFLSHKTSNEGAAGVEATSSEEEDAHGGFRVREDSPFMKSLVSEGKERTKSGGSNFRAEADISKEKETEQVFFGFSQSGSFGLKDEKNDEKGFELSKPDKPIKFAPFPGLPSTEERNSEKENATEAYDEVELTSSDNGALTPSDWVTPVDFRKILEMPIAFKEETVQKRAFFDKKVLFFDGFEQLSFANRIIVRTFCRMNRLGLLLTTHTPVIGVPVLFRAIPTVGAIHQLLDYLLEDFDVQISDSEVEALLKNSRYDVREMLFSLYDAFEVYRIVPRDLREKIVRRFPK